MKKSKFILVSLLICIVSILCSGCTGSSNMNMNTDGSGTFSCKYSIEKKIYSEKNYTKISSSKELVNEMKKKVPKGTDLKITLDTKTSKTEDIINVSFTYSSIAEFEKKIDLLTTAIDNSASSDTLDNLKITEKDYEKYNDIYNTEKVISTSLATHLKKNNIKYDTTSKNYKLLVSEIDSIINDESIYEDEDEDTTVNDDDYINLDDYDDDYDYDDEDYSDYDDEVPTYQAKIIKADNKTTLRISLEAITTLNMFMYSTISDYVTVKIDMDSLLKDTFTNIAELDVKACNELFEKVKLADAIKKIDLTKVDETTPATAAPTVAPTDSPKATATIAPTSTAKVNTTVAPTETATTVKSTKTTAATSTVKPSETTAATYDIDKLTETQVKSIFTKELKESFVKNYLELTEKYLDDMLNQSMPSSSDTNSIGTTALNDFKYTINFAGTKRTFTSLELIEKMDEDGYITISIPNKLGANQLDETPKTGDNSYGTHLLLVSFLLMTSIIVFKKIKQI